MTAPGFAPGNAPARPSASLVCEQLARYWVAYSALAGVTLAEPTSASAVSGHVWAGPLPPQAARASHADKLAASLTLAAQAGQSGYQVETTMAVVVEAQARSERAAMSMLADLRRLVRPGERPLVHRYVSGGAQDMLGVMGPPPASAWPVGSTIDLWRVLSIGILSEPQVLAVDAGPLSTPEGLAAAQMSLRVMAVPARLDAPLRALRIRRSITAAWWRVRVTHGLTLELSAGATEAGAVTVTLPLEDGTIADLLSAISAQTGWTADVPIGWVTQEERLARDLEPATTTVSGAAEVVIRVWA